MKMSRGFSGSCFSTTPPIPFGVFHNLLEFKYVITVECARVAADRIGGGRFL